MRGRASSVGDERVAPNGYHYTRTEDGWVLTHRVVKERQLGRKLLPNERVRFKDNDRTNFRDPDNIVVYTVGTKSKAKQRAELEAKIAELQGRLADLDQA